MFNYILHIDELYAKPKATEVETSDYTVNYVFVAIIAAASIEMNRS